MTTKLTTPIPHDTVTDITGDRVAILLSRNSNLVVDRAVSGLEYVLHKRDAKGNIIGVDTLWLALEDWPKSLRDSLKDLRNYLETKAEQQGYLPAGSKTEDLD